MQRIDMGDRGWKTTPDTGVLYGSEGMAKQAAVNHFLDGDKEFDENKVYEEDTRPTIGEVAWKLIEREDIVWDESGITVFPSIDPDDRWPEGQINVFVVTGGSEGLYLHVEVVIMPACTEPIEHKLVLIAKTLDCSTDKWYECWMSAARIARMLGA